MTKRPAKKKRSAPVPPAQSGGQPPAQKASLPPAKSTTIPWIFIGQIALIIAAGLWIYWPALNGDWVWDDSALITNNINLRNLDGLGRIWFSAPATDYWPLTFTALWAQWHLWGNHPLGYHLVNLTLHLLSGFLAWRLFNRLGLRYGWAGGLLFVIHPLAVESVAWNSEIKNTLSLPLLLLSLDSFMDADEGKERWAYVRSLLLYLAAMLAKTSVVMLPFFLLLFCWWKRDRITWRDLKRTIPYFVVALVLGLITLYFQSVHAPEDAVASSRGILTRLIGAGIAVCFYIEKFILPIKLSPLYSRWSFDPPSFLQLLPIPLFALLCCVLWVYRKRWGRHAVLGLGFFLINILPVVGILPMVYMNVSWVADHLAYLPMIGLIGLSVAGAEAIERTCPSAGRMAALIMACLGCVLLVWGSHNYAKIFSNQEIFYTRALKFQPEAWKAHNNFGLYLLNDPGKLQEAISQFEVTVQLEPDSAEGHMNLGLALSKLPGHSSEAIAEYNKALLLRPDYPDAHINLGVALSKLPGRIPDAIAEYKKALEIDPYNAGAHANLGNALLRLPGRLPDAIAEYKKALEITPDSADMHFNLGVILKMSGRESDAIEQYEAALHINPDYAEANNALGITLANYPERLPEAIVHFKAAVKEKPDFAEARRNLEIAQQMLNHSQSPSK